MDNWNRNNQNEYTGISAQRRNRRRTGTAPVTPDRPGVPAEPKIHKAPAVPAEPAIPAEPRIPDEPEVPATPEIPTEPVIPAEPENPEALSGFAEPDIPGEPEIPAAPENPTEPVIPAEPENPEAPSGFAEPDIPGEAEIPAAPENPAVPEIPATAEIPAETDGPAEPEASDAADPAEKKEAAEEKAKTEKPEAGEEPPVVQGADSRVPPEARRMAAAPYGTDGSALGRTGSRLRIDKDHTPQAEERRTPVRPRNEAPAGESGRDIRRVPQAKSGYGAGRNPAGESAGNRQKAPYTPPKVRVHVGYAPGRMTDDETREIPSERAVRESLYSRDAKAYLEKRKHPFRPEGNGKKTPPPTGSKALRTVVTLLIVAGLILTGWMFVKGRNGKDGPNSREAPQVISFVPPNMEGLFAPVDLTFTATTAKDVEGIRLRAEGDRDLDTVVTLADNADNKHWMLVMHVETSFKGAVTLQARREGEEEWYDTSYTASVDINSAIGEEQRVPENPEPVIDEEDDDYYNEDEENREDADAELSGGAEPKEKAESAQEAGNSPEDEMEEEPADWEEDDGELPMGALKTQEPTPTPVPATPAPTDTPAPVFEAAPEANPDLITSTTVYTSVTKKEKNYSRPAKELIHMPAADQYTERQLGVMTFRGDNFRRNAAVGTMSAAPLKFSVMWKTEAGSARGTNQTFYGYGWTGQPVIARWSTEIKASSNITEAKKEQNALKEVIIAGVDGSIRFLDLKDGKITRNSIKLGYPMRGTPSLHTRGYPFMSVGQFARKMKNKTGMIGLRQYNLYNQEPTKLIDGLDGKYHRPVNDIGSFETSALIDRESDTLIAVGTNGALYLEALNSTFDFNMGVMKISPSFTVMTSKVKGVKNKALFAVESSPAAYDRYVFYADMGGVLRCVDTNTLTPVWAVNTGDSVMAAIAMDMPDGQELNLYTANMLSNRKKGNSSIQIRRYDAMSGREEWCTDIGVYKGKKDKDDVGAKASPVIGLNGLNDLVYFTVTGLSDDGRSALGLAGEEKAALIALNKDSGKIVWTFGLESRSESSPIAMYDKKGNGWIVQCEQNGIIHLLEGLTG